jgi:hypothetical protein
MVSSLLLGGLTAETLRQARNDNLMRRENWSGALGVGGVTADGAGRAGRR